MRNTFIAFALVISGLSGNLQASNRPRPAVHSTVHRVRKGETAARIARQSGITLEQLGSLNPGVNLGRLAAGTVLRVKLERAASLPGRKPSGLVRARNLGPFVPVAPLPGTPAIGPGNLVHMERILPAEGLSPVPVAVNPGRSSSEAPAAAPVPAGNPVRAQGGGPAPALTGLRKVLPQEDEPDELEAMPSAGSPTDFTPADRDNLDLLWPVPTRTISSAWGPRIRTRVVRVRTSTRNRRVIRRFMGTHKGVDLSAPMGAGIFAALDGQVVASTRQKQYGNYVAVDHGNGVLTLYAHCSRNCVQVGDIVRRGQKIAEVGRTGNATGPHLHFELRLDGVPQNPLPAMNDMEEVPADLLAQNQAAAPPEVKR